MIRKPTIRNVATAAGVSVGTASRVINGHANVGEAVSRRVNEAIRALGFTPDPAAQSMRGGATHSVGIIIRDITVPALASFARAAQDTLHDAGYVLLILCSNDLKSRELEFLDLLRRRRVDGLIIATSSEEDADVAHVLRQLDFPVVLLDREAPLELDATLINHEQGIREATRHLLSLGHRRIGLITGSPGVFPARARIAGYRKAFAEVGLEADAGLVRTGGFDIESACFEATVLLTRNRRPTALIAGGIDMLGGAIRAIRAAMLAIPKDISLVGSADTELSMFSTPPTSVVRWDAAEQGRWSAQLILSRIASRGQEEPHRLTLNSEYVIRGSCAAPPAEPLLPDSGVAEGATTDLA